jgi:hypothetical protein
MGITYLELLDMIRFMFGLIFAEVVFANYGLEKRPRFWLRFIGCCLGLWLFTFTFFPIQLLPFSYMTRSIISAVWWLAAGWLTLGLLVFCYDVSVGTCVFCLILGTVLQEMMTVFIRYLWVGILVPRFPEEHPFEYTVVMLVVYVLVYLLVYYRVSERIHLQEHETVLNTRTIFWGNIIICLLFTLVQDLTSGLFSWVTTPDAGYGSMRFLMKIILPSYLTWMLAVFCVVLFLFMFMLYEIIYLQQERQMMRVLQREKEQQYQRSRENIDLINQKCHDLKHQLKALELVDDAKKAAAFAETNRAIQFYDAAVETGNEVLDTILTEKSLTCASQGINFSCNIKVGKIDFMDVLDVYTLLGNALDNAIEAVAKYEKEKRVISLTMREQGQMLNLFVDNYFEGKLKLKNGYPVTSKKDKEYHGFGVKSIGMIAKKYKGDIRISQDGQTFSLQVMIPRVEGKRSTKTD